MRKEIQKKRLALLLVGMLAIGQIPSGYVNAESTSVAQENTQVPGDNEESELVRETAEITDNSTTDDQVNESATEETEEDATNSDTSNETKTDSIVSNDEQNISIDTNDETTPAMVEDIDPQSAIIDADGFKIEGTTLVDYQGSATIITIPSIVTHIGDYAFNECTSLTSITIPDSVTSIGDYAFLDCTSLTSIILPNRIESIGSGLLVNCERLTSITIPNSVTSIGDETFDNCFSLTNITIPNSVTSIGSAAFYSCTSLTSITIPNSVTSIGRYAFSNCTSLTSITIPNSVTSIENLTFSGCTSLENITISDSVKKIGDSAFYGCTKLVNIIVPNSVNHIGKNAFAKCNGGNVKKITSGQATVSEEDYFVIYCGINSYAFSYAQENRAYGILAITSQDTTTINVESVTLNESNVNLTQGDTITLTAAVLPNNSSNKKVTWSSSDSNIASVDNTGKVTAISVGKVIVTATTEDGNKTAHCTVDVIEKQTNVSTIKLNSKKVTLAKKATFNLIATVSPTTATNPNVTWSSSNEKVATVTSSGKVKAISAGSAVITAIAQDGSNVSSSCKVTVPKATSYKITYKLNKGTNAAENPTYYATGNSVKLKKPTRKNYTFAGWYLGDKKVTSISKTTKGKITLTAKWDKVTVNKTTVKSAKNNKAGKIAVTFNEVKGVKGYTVYYSTNKKLKNAKTFNVSAKKKSATITGLEKGTTYYVTVKAYKVDSLGNIVYGKSNKTFKVAVKK